MRDEQLYVVHILECIDRIERYVVGQSLDQFQESHVTQDAVLRNLQVLAESCKRISDSTKADHQEIDWYKIAGFRNVLVHDYLGVDLERVWLVVQNDLPALKEQIAGLQ